jgi:hypothetical protein
MRNGVDTEAGVVADAAAEFAFVLLGPANVEDDKSTLVSTLDDNGGKGDALVGGSTGALVLRLDFDSVRIGDIVI